MLLARRAGLEHWPSAGTLLVALLAWFALASWLRRVALQPEPGTPLVWLDQAAALPAPRSIDREVPAQTTHAVPVQATLEVVFASQTGFAEQLARQTCQQLRSSGVAAQLRGLGTLQGNDLRAARRMLFVVSTTGDGDAPDDALPFFREYMTRAHDLSGLQYGILALGDRDYDDFCGFGRKLERWLRANGAQSLFDLVEVDSEDDSALRKWQHCLIGLGGDPDQPDWQAPHYQRWQLVERRLLNPGSAGAPCFHLALKLLQGKAFWEAGDVLEIGPCQGPQVVNAWLAAQGQDGSSVVKVRREQLTLTELLTRSRLPSADEVAGLNEAGVAAILQRLPHRAYSIASVPDDGAVHLLVRQMRGDDGRLGLGSSWLTEQAEVGAEIAARIRNNVNFHIPDDARPLILIGNGTGMAALRALLKARIAAGERRNWLLFGERQARHDFYYADEVRQWQGRGELERADFAWSRDQSTRVYVQHRLRESADALRRWVDDGAAIYVCGSLTTMAPAVDEVLRDMLGSSRVEQLSSQGRYRRDVY